MSVQPRIFCPTRRLLVFHSVRIPTVFDDCGFPSGGKAPASLWSEKEYCKRLRRGRKLPDQNVGGLQNQVRDLNNLARKQWCYRYPRKRMPRPSLAERFRPEKCDDDVGLSGFSRGLSSSKSCRTH
jgi:hypothetical protein